jgi:hypothetical protein
MPTQPLNSTTYISAAVTSMAIAYSQDPNDFVAMKVFPKVQVERQTGKYWIFDKAGFMRNDMQPRTSGTRAVRSGFTVSNASYDCQVFALGTSLSNQDRANWDSSGLGDVDRAKARFLMHQALQKYEAQWAADFFATGIWGTSTTPGTLWSTATSTPIEDVLTGKRTVKLNTGREPNTMVVGYDVNKALVRHPDIIDLIKYGAGPGNPAIVDQSALAKVFGVKNYYVCAAVGQTNVENETGVQAFLEGKHALLLYVTDAPSKEEPSAGYTFGWTGVGGGALSESVAISSWYDQDTRSDVWEIESGWDNVITGSDLGYAFISVVA